jgi:hypothetical protein
VAFNVEAARDMVVMKQRERESFQGLEVITKE